MMYLCCITFYLFRNSAEKKKRAKRQTDSMKKVSYHLVAIYQTRKVKVGAIISCDITELKIVA